MERDKPAAARAFPPLLRRAGGGAAVLAGRAGASARWLAYPFPGNVRELRNIVIRLTTKHAGQRAVGGRARARVRPRRRSRTGAMRPRATATCSRRRSATSSAAAASASTRCCKAWERGYIEAALQAHARQRQPGGEAARRQPHHALQPDEHAGRQGELAGGPVPRALRPERAAVPHHAAHRFLLRRRRPRRDAGGAALRDPARRGHRQGLRRSRQRQDHAVPRADGAPADGSRDDLPRQPLVFARRDPARHRRRTRRSSCRDERAASRCATLQDTADRLYAERPARGGADRRGARHARGHARAGAPAVEPRIEPPQAAADRAVRPAGARRSARQADHAPAQGPHHAQLPHAAARRGRSREVRLVPHARRRLQGPRSVRGPRRSRRSRAPPAGSRAASTSCATSRCSPRSPPTRTR